MILDDGYAITPHDIMLRYEAIDSYAIILLRYAITHVITHYWPYAITHCRHIDASHGLMYA